MANVKDYQTKEYQKRIHKLFTLCIVHQPPRVLLGMKKRGFGEGRWNGFGGKVAVGETIEQAARRELQEEAGITPVSLEHAGMLHFEFVGDPTLLEMHIFRCADFTGVVRESEEMAPQWFHQNDIPFHTMWPDDRYWFPFFLEGKQFRGRFLFDGFDTILSQELTADIDPKFILQ